MREHFLYNIYTDADHPLEFNGFKLYRSLNGVATTIEYRWPNSNGSMGELRKMEVIDAKYRGRLAYAFIAAYDYDNTALTNFDISGNDGTWYIYNKTNYDRTTAIPTNIEAFQNSGICSQWRNLYNDKTATENTLAWMTIKYFNLEGYAPYWTIHLDIDGKGWVIPNLFQVIVMYCCSDKLDELDPTFNNNREKGLGVTSFIKYISGRWSLSPQIWSSTAYRHNLVRSVHENGCCGCRSMDNAYGVVPIRELV